MNYQLLLMMTVALGALVSGCSRTHVMFMTKSNVGLDFDSKPPTLEVSVSRKEVVVGPTFENGQMPPVAASFKPRAGGSGFANFFLGVDQTFQGGDAAVAMAELYSSTNIPPPESKTKFNSALKLTKPPRYTGFFRRIPGPGESRTFIFGTDTSLGLKAAWSGAGGQFPDTVRLGFNRKEFAWAPLFMATNPPAGPNSNETYSIKIPSFLATIESHIGVGGTGDGGIKALQYFAAGESATLLALQPAVRTAMIARLDPTAAALDPQVQKQIENVNGNVEKALVWLYGSETKPKSQNLTTFLKGSRFENNPELFADLSKEQLRQKLRAQWHLEFASKLWPNVPTQP
jgi:hypothetical protein